MKYKKIFKDRKILDELLQLRMQGWSLKTLSSRYGVNQTSIRYWCMKSNLPNRIEIRMTLSSLPFEEIQWEPYIINKGKKSYKEYLAEARLRHPLNYYYARSYTNK